MSCSTSLLKMIRNNICVFGKIKAYGGLMNMSRFVCGAGWPKPVTDALTDAVDQRRLAMYARTLAPGCGQDYGAAEAKGTEEGPPACAKVQDVSETYRSPAEPLPATGEPKATVVVPEGPRARDLGYNVGFVS